jgi:hypothetical protein
MVVGCSNLPIDFDNELPGLERLLSSIEIRGKQGFDNPQLQPLKAAPDMPTAAATETYTSGKPSTGD